MVAEKANYVLNDVQLSQSLELIKMSDVFVNHMGRSVPCARSLKDIDTAFSIRDLEKGRSFSSDELRHFMDGLPDLHFLLEVELRIHNLDERVKNRRTLVSGKQFPFTDCILSVFDSFDDVIFQLRRSVLLERCKKFPKSFVFLRLEDEVSELDQESYQDEDLQSILCLHRRERDKYFYIDFLFIDEILLDI